MRSSTVPPRSRRREKSSARQAATKKAVWTVGAAGPGDHPAVFRFLRSIFQQPSTAEYTAQLEDPWYEPSDRRLIREGGAIIAHVRLIKREMQLGDLVLPVVHVTELATLPEFRQQGCASALLRESSDRMAEDGSMLATLRTDCPQFYRDRKWVVGGRHSYSTACPRSILARMNALAEHDGPPVTTRRGSRSSLNIRLWRHVEQAALMRLYQEESGSTWGRMVRTEAMWRWLINRRAYDRIYIAINGPDKFPLDDALDPIVGYAVMREGRILELMASPDHPSAGPQLLARACGDAIERDIHQVRLDAAPDHPLHGLLLQAGGERVDHSVDRGDVYMVNIPRPLELLERLAPVLAHRAREADLPRPAELGVLVGSCKVCIRLRPRSVCIETGRLGRSYVRASRETFLQMLLGHAEMAEYLECGRLETSTRVAGQLAEALFPRMPLWFPPLDHLPAP